MPTCPKCGYESGTENGVKIHFGRSHDGSISGTEVECSVCEKQFRKSPVNAEKYDRHFCSTECKAEGYRNHVELTCDYCGKDFTRNASHAAQAERHYCSTGCKGQAYRDRVELHCRNCGDAFTRLRAEYERSGGEYCSYDCMDEHMQGSAHPKWMGGRYVSDALRRKLHTESWHTIRKRERSRLPDECHKCRSSDDLALHHIIPIMAGGSHHPRNFMLLCQSCHQTVEFYTRDLLDYSIADAIAES